MSIVKNKKDDKKKTILIIIAVLVFSLVVGISIGSWLFKLVTGNNNLSYSDILKYDIM